MLHASLDKYAAIAVTGTPQSLDFLINEVKGQNEIWQQAFNKGRPYIRQFDVRNPTLYFDGMANLCDRHLRPHLLGSSMN
jgi:hypothetical protein